MAWREYRGYSGGSDTHGGYNLFNKLLVTKKVVDVCAKGVCGNLSVHLGGNYSVLPKRPVPP